jgi:integrase
MTETTTLLEPSIADVLKAIETATDLPASKRTHWSCSLRQICIYLNRPPEILPARWSGIKNAVYELHAARVGANAKTVANHKSNVRAALLWFAQEKNLPKSGAPLMPAWVALMGKVADPNRRKRLSGLARYCSAAKIAPVDVNEEVLDKYMRYRAETTRLAANEAVRRVIARAWNASVEEIKEWPRQRLIEPPVKPLTETPWQSFPQSLREEIEHYLAAFKRIRRGASGKRIRPCKESTIKTRRRELQAFARMAVRLGHPIESLTSLEVLLDPTLVDEVLNAYWDASEKEEPCVYTIDMAWKLLSAARETNSLPEADLAKLDDIRAAMEEHRQGGLTEKNLKVIRAVLTDGVWDEVVQLPHALTAEARLLRHQAPVKAAVIAQIATAIAILAFAPIRLGNLIQIKLDENLIKPGGLNDPYWLVFPHYDVKNRVRLNFKLVPQVGEIIDEYIHDYRSILLRGSNGPWLFPGETGGVKTSRTLSLQVTDRIEKGCGLRMTVHQFRHAAAAIYLKDHPGEYEIVRQLLGHRNIQTTMNFYVGLDMIQASELFSEIIRKRLNKKLEPAE